MKLENLCTQRKKGVGKKHPCIVGILERGGRKAEKEGGRRTDDRCWGKKITRTQTTTREILGVVGWGNSSSEVDLRLDEVEGAFWVGGAKVGSGGGLGKKLRDKSRFWGCGGR